MPMNFGGPIKVITNRRYTPNLKWPLQGGAMYTVILSNLDINNRKNRTLAEFWHWFVGNVPGSDIDSGDVIFDLLHPLVLKASAGRPFGLCQTSR